MFEILSLIQQNIYVQYFIIIFFGLFIGSLMNVFIYRLPIILMYENAILVKNNSIQADDITNDVLKKYKNFNLFFPDSTCPTCGHKIRWFENVPILSYIFLGGKCSKCNSKISLEYPLVELSNFLLWLFAFFTFGFSIQLLILLPLLTCLLFVFMVDLKNKIIFDSSHILIGCIGIILIDNNYIIGDISKSIFWSFIFYYCLLGFITFYEKLRNFDFDIFGRGDIKLLSVIFLYMNIYEFLNFMILTIILGLIFFTFLKLINKFDVNKEIPFAPMIVFSFLLFLFEININFISIY